ncbi:uncharacterized protein F54F2.9 [Episyrphus balteatus]|uniref:uncharacterized protein F54F2.9 n=1 Tax=Episyrphus balteatus TaxID=286459 RepID=UPI0024869876|nr:uncharacterized protein F54F2.9 [Episyrphus balteatus]
MKSYIICLFLLAITYGANAWDKDELEIFDLVEEINKNFYEVMGISQDATGQEIKRAFRNLSIVLHPDKNNAEDANIQFRNLVSIYEVLKDPSKREKYNKVLKEGLPNWKSALYYYRRMRKVGLYEGAAIIFVIISVGQYLFSWAAYLEKKYTAEQVFGSRLKKLQKKNKNIDLDAILNEIPPPSILNTLPFQIPMFFWNLPTTIKSGVLKANEMKEAALEKRRLEAEEIKRQQELEEEFEEMARARKEKKENIRKRRQATKAPEKTDADLAGYSRVEAREFNENDAVKPVTQKTTPLSGGFWTDEDLAELIRLVKKYPGGAGSRWETIAETMNRSVQEVTFMAAKMKENGYRIPGQTDSVAENIVQDVALKKEKLKKNDKTILIPEKNWSQEQQRALENAIVKYRKAAGSDRWQKIANCVPEKTKEECLLRYKHLCDLVKSQKSKAADDEEKNEEDEEDKGTETTANRVEDLQDDDNAQADVEEEEEQDELKHTDEEQTKSKGKKRNKRKERRRRREYSSDEDSDDEGI